LRAYFIRRGDHTEPVRYEVDRIRNGRSFSTRRVVARQAVGAILNLEASFQKAEASEDVQSVEMDESLPLPDGLDATTTWTPSFERRFVPESAVDPTRRTGTGRVAAWTKVNVPVGDEQLVHRCWLAYLSDDFPFDAVRGAVSFPDQHGGGNASLDHTIWFHRPVRADEWLLHDFSCHGYAGGRGLAIGHVFTTAGLHVATVAQEALYRAPRAES
jgi:acyl-CoA thioesterase-2